MRFFPSIVIEAFLSSLEKEIRSEFKKTIEMRKFVLLLDLEKTLKRICKRNGFEPSKDCEIELVDDKVILIFEDEEGNDIEVELKIDIELKIE